MSLTEALATFLRGGVHAPHRKNTAECATIVMPAPQTITVAMSQHLGAPCIPTVKVGDTVEIGQVIGDNPSAPLCSPVHSGVSGTVTAITEYLMPGGRTTQAVVIEADGENRVHESVKPPVVNTKEDFLQAVRASGLVGLGGAGFPMHVKLNPPHPENIDTLLINAAECEPYITADYRTCIEDAEDVIGGLKTVMQFLDVRRVIIAIENNKPKAIELFSRIAAEHADQGREVLVKALPARYPQGAEKVLIYACTGRRVPAGKLPADVGCIVMNVTSVAFLNQYLRTGMPLVTKRITVDGSAILSPKNIRATVGTPIRDIIDFVGGTKTPVAKLLMGGPMMGISQMDDSQPLLKQNNAILAFAEKDVVIPRETNCIRCGRCVAVCPMRLMPTNLTKAYKADDVDELKRLNVMSCMECGCCSFSCPAHRPIVQTMRLAKDVVRSSKK